MKEKVVYIGGFELPDKNAAAQRVIGNAKALRNLSYEVYLVGLSREGERNRFLFEGFNCFNMPYPNTTIQWLKYLSNVDEEIKLIRSLNASKVILYNYPALKIMLLKNKLKDTSTKFYSDITEWYEVKSWSMSAFIKRIDVTARMKFINYKMDGLIVISDFLQNYYTAHSNVINIPPLIDASDNKWIMDSSKNNSEKVNFVYAGSPGFGQKDSLTMLIDNFYELWKNNNINAEINIIGITKSQFIANFKDSNFNYLNEIDLPIYFHGRVSHIEAIEMVKKASFSILFRPNNLINTAGFPTKFVESISAGTPVISNYSSNLKNYFDKYDFIGYGIDLLDNNSIKNVLLKASSTSLSEIMDMKAACCKSRIFDYRHFVKDFELCLKN